MSMIYILIPLSLVLVAAAVWAFFWAVKSGQFDDLETPALKILEDDFNSPSQTQSDKKSSEETPKINE